MTDPKVAALAEALHTANPIGSVAHIAASVDDPGGYLDGWDEEHGTRHRADAERTLAALDAAGWTLERAGLRGRLPDPSHRYTDGDRRLTLGDAASPAEGEK